MTAIKTALFSQDHIKNITSAKIYEDGKEVQVTKDTDKDRISFEADAGKTYTIDISETNINELKEQASTFLNQLHPDLINAKNELQTAIDLSSKRIRYSSDKSQTNGSVISLLSE